MKQDIIHCGDCLEWLRSLPDGCADLILTDPPYNIGKADWDKVAGYVGWLCDVFDECRRVAKDNATLIWWHNDLPQVAALMVELERRGNWRYNCHVVCNKPNFRAPSWINRASFGNNLRTWFNITETALVYVNSRVAGRSTTGLERIHSLPEFGAGIRAYLRGELERAGLTVGQFGKLYKEFKGGTGWTVYSHWFAVSQFECITRAAYEDFCQGWLRERVGVPDLYPMAYEALREEYEGQREEYEGQREVHNLDPMHCNVWEWREANNSKLHPCRKPVSLLQRLVRVHSHPGALVLDPFAGSGSTGEACIIEHRRFMGCERDKRYADIARRQIAQAVPCLPGLAGGQEVNREQKELPL